MVAPPSLSMRKRWRFVFHLLVLGLMAISLVCGCRGRASGQGSVTITGAGATFPYPLYSKWIAEYNRLNPSVRINYQSIGSGGGIRQLQAGTVDFGATDAPMSPEEQLKSARPVVHIPTVLGAVALGYNLQSDVALELEPGVVAEIFSGRITRWSDPAIQKTNNGFRLPDETIRVIHRTDGSGSTAVFTSFLADVYPLWRSEIGVGKSVRWPVGLGAKGNEGVAGQIKSTPYAIGYIELAYARQNKLGTCAIRNRAGIMVSPSPASMMAAAEGAPLPSSLTTSLHKSSAPQAYPLTSYTYVIVHQDAEDSAKGQAIAKFLWWALHEGQSYAEPLHYAPLPPSAVRKVEPVLKSLTSRGQPLLAGL